MFLRAFCFYLNNTLEGRHNNNYNNTAHTTSTRAHTTTTRDHTTTTRAHTITTWAHIITTQAHTTTTQAHTTTTRAHTTTTRAHNLMWIVYTSFPLRWCCVFTGKLKRVDNDTSTDQEIELPDNIRAVTPDLDIASGSRLWLVRKSEASRCALPPCSLLYCRATHLTN